MPKVLSSLHPSDLLKDMTDVFTPGKLVGAQVLHQLLGEHVEIRTAKDLRGVSLHILDEQGMREMKTMLQRALNVWDEAPQWIWQLDAMLSLALGEMSLSDITPTRKD